MNMELLAHDVRIVQWVLKVGIVAFFVMVAISLVPNRVPFPAVVYDGTFISSTHGFMDIAFPVKLGAGLLGVILALCIPERLILTWSKEMVIGWYVNRPSEEFDKRLSTQLRAKLDSVI